MLPLRTQQGVPAPQQDYPKQVRAEGANVSTMATSSRDLGDGCKSVQPFQVNRIPGFRDFSPPLEKTVLSDLLLQKTEDSHYQLRKTYLTSTPRLQGRTCLPQNLIWRPDWTLSLVSSLYVAMALWHKDHNLECC